MRYLWHGHKKKFTTRNIVYDHKRCAHNFYTEKNGKKIILRLSWKAKKIKIGFLIHEKRWHAHTVPSILLLRPRSSLQRKAIPGFACSFSSSVSEIWKRFNMTAALKSISCFDVDIRSILRSRIWFGSISRSISSSSASATSLPLMLNSLLAERVCWRYRTNLFGMCRKLMPYRL